MKTMKWCTVVMTIALTAITSWSADAPPKQVKVKMEKLEFSPKELSIPVGTTVIWQNADDVPHTVTARSKPPLFDSKSIDVDKTYSFTFTKAGTYEYYCKFHKHMGGKITVK